MIDSLRVGLIVPTLNAGADWGKWLDGLRSQTLKPGRVLVIDSGSSDRTVDLARQAGLEVRVIAKADFNHGGTRQAGSEYLSNVEIVVFLTQDAILAHPESLARLVEVFDDDSVAAAYGRQLPRPMSGPIESHARYFNYPLESRVKSRRDIDTLGIKTVFISNSFSAYRREVLLRVGGFPRNTILAEDMHVAAKMVLSGRSVAYSAKAVVIHSHDYSFAQEFKRYFDIGVFNAREPWIQKEFGRAGNEGLRYVASELRYLGLRHLHLVPSSLLRNGLKFFGYKLGKMEKKLPVLLKKMLSMHRAYWDKEGGATA